jgi:hypothetical protein
MCIIHCRNCRRLYINETGHRRINEDWNFDLVGRYTRKMSALAEHRTNTEHVFSLSVFVREYQYPDSSFKKLDISSR